MVSDILKQNTYRILYLILGCLLIACFIVYFPFSSINADSITILTIILAILTQFLLAKINKGYDIFHPLGLFVIFYCYAMAGNYYAVTKLSTNFLTMVDFKNLDKTVYYCFACFLSFITASLISSYIFRKKVNFSKLAIFKEKFPHKRVLSILFYLTLILLTTMYTCYLSRYNYYAADYGSGEIDRTSLSFQILFISYFWTYLSLFLYTITSTIYNKKIFTTPVILFILPYFAYGFLNNTRTLMIQILLMLLFSYSIKINLGYVKPLSLIKKIIAILLSLVVLLFILVFGVLARSADTVKPQDQIKAFSEQLCNPVVVDLSLNQVLTVLSNYPITTNVMNYVPEREPFMLGSTYGIAIYNLIPRIITRNYSSNLTAWFKNYYNPSFTGSFAFAMEAEAYINFGYLGFIVFAFWSMFLTNLYYKYKNNPYLPWNAFIYIMVFLVSLFCIRGESFLLVKITIYSYIFILILKLFFYKRKTSIVE